MNKEELIEIVVSYAEKVFFYCVKRCNNRMDAEDLSQNILLECINQINKGTVIDNMDYYIWGVCKNQFNLYLRHKIKDDKNNIYVEEIFDASNEQSILDSIIQDEKIKMMNVSIKLLSKEYSEILYAYYVEDKTLKSISEELKLPLGTVKWKLSLIREKLKEYLKMERLNGKKAYIPKEFVGVMAGRTDFNPFVYTDQLMIKNFLYHSFNNPCTVEDYSIELGISKPYVEDYIESFLQKELLIKVDDNKYLTNIAFIDKNLRRKIYDYVRDNIDNVSTKIINFCKENLSYYKSLLNNPEIDDEHLMWSFLYLTVINNNKFSNDYKYTKHYTIDMEYLDNLGWDFMMAETLNEIHPDEFFISFNSNGSKDEGLIVYSMPAAISRNEASRITHQERQLDPLKLASCWLEIIKKNLNYSTDLNSNEKEKVDKLIEENYIKVVNDKVIFKCPCIDNSKFQELVSKIKSCDEIKNEFEKINNSIKQMLKNYLSPNLESQLEFIIKSLSLVRSLVLSRAYDAGILKDEAGKYFPYNNIVVLCE